MRPRTDTETPATTILTAAGEEVRPQTFIPAARGTFVRVIDVHTIELIDDETRMTIRRDPARFGLTAGAR